VTVPLLSNPPYAVNYYLLSFLKAILIFSGKTECCQPVEVVSYKIGVCKVSAHGKECRTEFQRMSYNGKSSVVLCRPFTGRMHQIRVHLQFLGNLHNKARKEEH
jgi:hypothetical protein